MQQALLADCRPPLLLPDCLLLLAPLLQPFTLKVAVASGLDFAMPLLDAVRNGTNTYNFLEASLGGVRAAL